MKTKLIIWFFLIFSMILSPLLSTGNLFVVEAGSIEKSDEQDDIVVVRVYYERMEDIELLSTFDLFEFNNKAEKYVLVAINKSEISRLEALGFTVSIDRIETLNFQLLFDVPLSQIESGGMEIQTIPGYSCYRTVEETYAAAQMIADLYPNLASWIDVGDSWEKSVGQPDGYDLMVMKLTNASIQTEKPRLFIIAAIHAREYATAELALRYAEYLVSNYNIDPDITWILDHHEIHIMFQANPDGRKEAEAGLSWRKNTNENYCGVTSNSRGADLNRNFSYAWGGAGASTNPCDATYRGPSAASEPETVAIRDYMLSLFPDQRGTGAAPNDTTGIFLDIHSYGGYVLWPWGYTTSATPNDAQLQTLGRKFAYFNGYMPGQTGPDLYTCSGVTNDYSYGELGIPSYTFEVGTTFFQSCSTFEGTIYPANLQSLLYAAKVPRTPYMTPLGPDALNVSVSESVVFEGQSVVLSAEINDTRYNNSNGTEATQNIAAAEFYVDTPYWEPGATSLSMSPVDGAFNAKIEQVSFTIDTTGWNQGRHTLFVRGQDLNGNWGAVSAVFLTVETSDNEPPMADDLGVVTEEDLPVSIELTGFDPDGNPLTFNAIDMPAHGTLSGTSPFLTYTPDPDYFGDDLFTYQANDGIANSPLATVSITVSPVNDEPIAMDQSVSVEINSPVDIVLEGIDVDGDPVTFSLLSSPAFGSLTGTPPNLQYIPNTGFTGDDSFSFIVSDGLLDSDTAYVTITVNPPGPVQVFWDDFESDLGWVVNPFGTDTATTGLWEWADPESVYYNNGYVQLGEPVSGNRDLVTGALAGSSAGSYDIDNGITSIRSPEIFLPDGRELTLSFSYYLAHASNSNSSDYLRVTIIGETNQLVFEELGAANYDYSSWEEFSTDISAFSGQTIRLLIEAADAGTASLVESAVDDVLIEGLLINNAPVADSNSISVEEDSFAVITLTGSDIDGDPLNFAVESQPSNGTLSGTAPNLTYSPDTDFNGTDSFTFKVNDGTVDSNLAVVSITLNPINDKPIAYSQYLTTTQETQIAIALLGSDVDDDILTYIVTSGPSHGDLTGNDANRFYTPASYFAGIDSLTFVVFDGTENSEPATVMIEVTSINYLPIVYNQEVLTDEESSVQIELSGMDPNGDLIDFYILEEPLHGLLSGTSPNLTYTPDQDYDGNDHFTFYASDGVGDSDPGMISITINAINDAPNAIDQVLTLEQDTSIEVVLTGQDVDDDDLTFIIVDMPVYGSLTGSSPDFIYTPEAGYSGEDSLTFVASDGEIESNLGTITFIVTPSGPVQVFWDDFESNLDWVVNPNQTDPAALGIWERAIPQNVTYNSYTTQLGTTVSGVYDLVTGRLAGSSAGSYDIDGGKTSIRSPLIDLPSGKDLSLSFSYYLAHLNNASPADYLRVTVIGESNQTVFQVLGSGTYVSAVWRTAEVNLSSFAGQTIYLLIEAADDGSASLVEAGIDDVLIVAKSPNLPPSAYSQNISLAEDTNKEITLSGFDPNGDPISYEIIANPQNGSLSGSLPEVIYTPFANFNGLDQFSFISHDGSVASEPALIQLTVSPINDSPVAESQNVTIQTDSSLEILLSADDVDGDLLTFTIVNPPDHGVLTGTAPNVVYTPAAGFIGDDAFSFIASDGLLQSSAEVGITITPPGPVTVFFDDFESDQGWTTNPFGNDTASAGIWERDVPIPVNYYGYKQLVAYSGSYDLVTGSAGASWWWWFRSVDDVNNGLTSIRSPEILLPAGLESTLSLRCYFAHASNASTSDYFRLSVIGNTTKVLYEELGDGTNDDAVWDLLTLDLSDFSGQTITILIETSDGGSDSLVEAAVDDVMIIAE